MNTLYYKPKSQKCGTIHRKRYKSADTIDLYDEQFDEKKNKLLNVE